MARRSLSTRPLPKTGPLPKTAIEKVEAIEDGIDDGSSIAVEDGLDDLNLLYHCQDSYQGGCRRPRDTAIEEVEAVSLLVCIVLWFRAT